MKRLTAILLTLSMLLSIVLLSGCNTEPKETTASSTADTSSSKDAATETSASTTESSSAIQTTDTTATSDSTSNTDIEDTSSDTTEEENPYANWDPHTKLPGYEDLSFGGQKFLIAGYKDASDGYDTEREVYSEDTDTIADGANTKTYTVEKLYNCDIEFVGAESPNQFIDAANAGGETVHLLCSKYSHASVATNGKNYNLYGMGIDLSQPWFDQNYVNSMSLSTPTGEKLYGVVGDFCICNYVSMIVLFVNTDVYDTAVREKMNVDIYDLVRTGKWTMDIWMEMIALGTYDANGNSSIDPEENDIVGYLHANSITLYNLHKASGLRMIDKENGVFKFMMPSQVDQWSTVINKGLDVLNTYGTLVYNYTKAKAHVGSGRCLFHAQILRTLENEEIKNSDVKLCAIPFPKISEAQEEYHTAVEQHLMAYSVPTCVANIDEVADFFTVYAAHSTGILRPAWVNSYAYEYLSGTQAAEMLDILLDSRDYDPGYYMLSSWQGEIHAVLESGQNNITRVIERRSAKWSEDLAALIQNITNNPN